MPEIIIEDLTVIYPAKRKQLEDVTALSDFSAHFLSGSFNVVVGYSGCGKTTLLRTIAGLQDYAGTITIDDVDAGTIEPQKRNAAYVSQQYTLYPKMTIFDNIAAPLIAAKVPKAEIIERVMKISEELDLIACLTRKPKQISGGQQQRVALARALCKEPQICLLDEPLSNVDERLRAEERRYIKKVLLDRGCTVIYVTHDIKEATALADQLIVMDAGRVCVAGDPWTVCKSGDPVMTSLLEG